MSPPDPPSPPPAFLGVLAGFACVFLLFSRRDKKPPVDGAELLLQSATQQMKEAQAKNRVRAVQAITQKNNLQATVDQMQRMIDRLETKAEAAREEGDVDRERSLRAERDKAQVTLAQTQAGLENAIVTTEAVKTAMRREEARIRAQTAQALAMRAEDKQAQIALAMEQSRLAMTTNYATDLFTRAQAKIQQAQARNRLIAEIRQTVETLEAAAEAADASGDEALRRRLLDGRDRLRERALDPKLGL